MVQEKETVNQNHNMEQDIRINLKDSKEESRALENGVTMEQNNTITQCESEDKEIIIQSSNEHHSCQECTKVFLNLAAYNEHLEWHNLQKFDLALEIKTKYQNGTTEQIITENGNHNHVLITEPTNTMLKIDSFRQSTIEKNSLLKQDDNIEQSDMEEEKIGQSICVTMNKSDTVKQNDTAENLAVEQCVFAVNTDENITKTQTDHKKQAIATNPSDIKEGDSGAQSNILEQNLSIDQNYCKNQIDTEEPTISKFQNDFIEQSSELNSDSSGNTNTLNQNVTPKEILTYNHSSTIKSNICTKPSAEKLAPKDETEFIHQNGLTYKNDVTDQSQLKGSRDSLEQSDILVKSSTKKQSDNDIGHNFTETIEILESTNSKELSNMMEKTDSTEQSGSMDQSDCMGLNVSLEESHKSLTCQPCSKIFLKQSDYNDHQNWHLEEKQHPNPYVKLEKVYLFTCEVCNRGFIEEFKQETSVSVCKACSHVLSVVQEAYLEPEHWSNVQHAQHLISSYVKLSRDGIYACDRCNNGYLDYNSLKNHRKKHIQKQYRSNSQENNQIEKPYTCDSCDWRFALRSTLEAHSVLHKPFPHICECGIGYYKRCDLVTHRRLVHTAELTTTTVKAEIKYKPPSDYESDQSQDDNKEVEYKPSHKIGPRLNATLTLKQANTKQSTRTPVNYIQATECNDSDSVKEEFKPSRVGPKLRAELTYKKPKSKKPQRNLKSFTNYTYERDDSGRYMCPCCPKTYTLPKGVQNHLLEHTGGRPFKCDECPRTFVYRGMLAAHKERHAGIKRYPCELCDRKFSDKSNLKTHMVVHTKEKPHKCQLCHKGFSQAGALKLHALRHTGRKDHACDLCEKRFYGADALVRHKRVHTREKPFECKECGKAFADPSARRRHEVIHTGERPHACNICPSAFADRSALHVHLRRHAGVRYACPVCSKPFKTRGRQVAHTKTTHHDTGERYQCHHCDKRFTLKMYLVSHMRQHFPGAYTCDICGKTFQRKEYVKSHIAVKHVRDFRHRCDVCGIKFAQKCGLKAHVARVHCKVKVLNYECDHCHMSFYNKEDLQKHIARIHLRLICGSCKKAFNCVDNLRKHEVEGCLRCPICFAVFSQPSKLAQHRSVHHLPESERQIHECDICWKRFPLLIYLSKHRSIHNKKFEFFCDHCSTKKYDKNTIRDHIWSKHMLSLYCDVCLKRFYCEYDFRQHKRARCVKKEVICEICDKVFNTNASLRVHLKKHGPKKYECDLCRVKYKFKGMLIRHMRSAHKNKKRVSA